MRVERVKVAGDRDGSVIVASVDVAGVDVAGTMVMEGSEKEVDVVVVHC